MTKEEARKHTGGASTQAYLMPHRKDGDEGSPSRLCTTGDSIGEGTTALYHLIKDHFGLGNN